MQASCVAGVTLVQLRSSGTDNQQRHAVRVIGQMLEKREHRVIGPMQILEHQHGRALLGDLLQKAPPRREQLLALRRRAGLKA